MHWHLEWRLFLGGGKGCGGAGEEGRAGGGGPPPSPSPGKGPGGGFVRRAEDRRVREDAPLGAFLRRHLEAGGALEGGGGEGSSGGGGGGGGAAAEAAAAAAAAAAPLPFRALLRLDGRPANSPGWLDFSLEGENGRFSFDEDATLAELLRGRTVDEFPVVALVAAAGSCLAPLPPGEVVAFARAAPAVAHLPPVAAIPPPSAPSSAVAEGNREVSQL